MTTRYKEDASVVIVHFLVSVAVKNIHAFVMLDSVPYLSIKN